MIFTLTNHDLNMQRCLVQMYSIGLDLGETTSVKFENISAYARQMHASKETHLRKRVNQFIGWLILHRQRFRVLLNMMN